MSAITFSGISFTGTPDTDDIRAASLCVLKYNSDQLATNPNFTPLAVTPSATLKTNYLTVLLVSVTSIHNGYIAQSKTPSGIADIGFTAAEQQTILGNLASRLLGGEPKATIIADTVN